MSQTSVFSSDLKLQCTHYIISLLYIWLYYSSNVTYNLSYPVLSKAKLSLLGWACWVSALNAIQIVWKLILLFSFLVASCTFVYCCCSFYTLRWHRSPFLYPFPLIFSENNWKVSAFLRAFFQLTLYKSRAKWQLNIIYVYVKLTLPCVKLVVWSVELMDSQVST